MFRTPYGALFVAASLLSGCPAASGEPDAGAADALAMDTPPNDGGGPCADPDRDRDGERSLECGGADCDDDDAMRSPARLEFCDVDAGINVFTTLNVQHLESLNDIIAQITGIVVRETIPDSVLERADDIELADLTPEELIERLREGKVYIPQQAERALQHFFQKANLQALRELSLRQAARRLQRDVELARLEKAARTPWPTSERLLVCIGPSPTTAKLIRTAKRMAAALGAEWLAVTVETQGERPAQAQARQRTAQNLRLAEQLGAETHTLVGQNLADTILEYARSRNVTKIVVGKTAVPRWKRFLFGTVVDHLLDKSGDIDVYVIRGEAETAGPATPVLGHRRVAWRDYLATAGIVALCTLVGWLSHVLRLTEANVVMVFLLGVVCVAVRFGRGPAIAASVASVLVFDFFFVPPQLSFAVADAQYLVTFAVMLAVVLLGIAVGGLLVVGVHRHLLRAQHDDGVGQAAIGRDQDVLGGQLFFARGVFGSVDRLGRRREAGAALAISGRQMARAGVQHGLATLCIGGGQGGSLILERP